MQVKYFSFVGLLFSFVALFAAYPFVLDNKYVALFILICFTAIAFFSVYAITDNKIFFIVAIALALPGIFIDWVAQLDDSLIAQVIDLIFSILFYVYISLIALKYIFHRSIVTINIIFGAIVVYLMQGLIWACCYTLLELLAPGSFHGLVLDNPLTTPSDAISCYMQSMFYFSYITITTVGYGNIAPASVGANAMCAAEAVIGQLYLTILIARFVGLHISQLKNN